MDIYAHRGVLRRLALSQCVDSCCLVTPILPLTMPLRMMVGTKRYKFESACFFTALYETNRPFVIRNSTYLYWIVVLVAILRLLSTVFTGIFEKNRIFCILNNFVAMMANNLTKDDKFIQ